MPPREWSWGRMKFRTPTLQEEEQWLTLDDGATTHDATENEDPHETPTVGRLFHPEKRKAESAQPSSAEWLGACARAKGV